MAAEAGVPRDGTGGGAQVSSATATTRGSALPGWVGPLVLALVALAGVSLTLAPMSWCHLLVLWPYGLTTAALVAAPAAWRPLVLLGVGAAAGATGLASGVGPALAAALGGATVTTGLVSALLLGVRLRTGDGGVERPSLASLSDLRRWLLSSLVGPVAGTAVAVGVAILVDERFTALAAALALASAAMGQLVVTLAVLRVPADASPTDPTERWLQRAALGGATVAALALQPDVVWAFGLATLWMWGALRQPLREMVVQMLATTVGVVAASAAGLGPFAGVYAAVPFVRVEAVELQVFLISAVLLVVPCGVVAQQLRLRSAEAHQERELVGRIMDSATRTAIVALDRDGRITSFNVGAETLLAYRAEEVLGQTLDLLVPRSELQSQADAAGTAPEFRRIARALTLTTTEPRDWRLRRKSGEVRTHSLSITPMSDERGTVVGYVCTSEDVTARVQRQDALLAALLTEREAVQRLEQADRMKDALVSTVSHELRTPLTSILGYTTMLVDGDLVELPPMAVQTLERILSNGERLRSLVEDLLVLSRVNAGQLELAAAPLDLRDVVVTAHEVVAPTLDKRRLDVHVDLPDDPALVNGDASMLERVVLNLLTNALKFTPDGGRIDVLVTLEAEEVVLEVSDNGLGIPAEEQDQLFTQFFRSTIAKKEAIQGTGLGLSIARAIVDQHGGVIGATSEPGTGSTFLVVLPRLVPPAYDEGPGPTDRGLLRLG